MNFDVRSVLANLNTHLKILTPSVRNQTPLRTVDNPVSTVTISDAARQAATVDLKNNSTVNSSSAASELRDLIKQYDFHNITPRQMAALGGELYKRGELSEDEVGGFIGVEKNTEVEMNPDKPIDMVAHFNRMLDTFEAAARDDSTMNSAAVYRRQDSKALADVMSFVSSDRRHVST